VHLSLLVTLSICFRSYNSVVDEEFAPIPKMPNSSLWYFDEELRDVLTEMNDPNIDGCEDQGDGTPGACPLSQNIDASSVKEGPAFENIVTGVACGRLIAATATEKSSIAWLYDITNLASPTLIDVFHLSPGSRNKSPGLAYNDGTLGEIDSESFFFLSAAETPNGKAALVFEGAFSGTVSWWEFDCVEPDDPTEQNLNASNARSNYRTAIIPAVLGSAFLLLVS